MFIDVETIFFVFLQPSPTSALFPLVALVAIGSFEAPSAPQQVQGLKKVSHILQVQQGSNKNTDTES